ncbi:MAG: histidine kinase dimerization/phospho-acceptor domain-containing protein, partial [Rhodoferax sp.]
MAAKAPSNNRRYLFWQALGTASLALVMAVLLVLQITQRRVIQTTGVVGVDSITALSFQFEREFLRFREVLESNVAGSAELDVDAIGMRYDILASRLGLLQDNPSIANLAAREEYKRVMPKILALFDRSDQVLAQVPLDRKALAELLTEFRAIGPDVQALSLAANSQVSRMLEAQEKQLLGQNQQIIVLTIVQMVVLLVAAAGLAIRQQRQERERAALESLTRDLQAAKQAAEAANLGKSQFLANMSHELRTPFNGMLGMLTLLETTPVNTQQSDYIQTAKGSANHLLMLLNDILDVSALDAGKITLKNESLHLAAVLKEVDDLMRPVASAKHIGFSIAVLTDIPEWVLADSTRLKQILFNLVNNAIKFTEHGSVNITISKHPRTDGKVGLAFEVTDTGIGMDDQVLARLFQRFYQVDTGL